MGMGYFGPASKLLLFIGLVTCLFSSSLPSAAGLKCYKCLGPPCGDGLGEEVQCDKGCSLIIDLEGETTKTPNGAYARDCSPQSFVDCIDGARGLVGLRECHCQEDLCNSSWEDIKKANEARTAPPAPAGQDPPASIPVPSPPDSGKTNTSASAPSPSATVTNKPEPSSAPRGQRQPSRSSIILILVTIIGTAIKLSSTVN